MSLDPLHAPSEPSTPPEAALLSHVQVADLKRVLRALQTSVLAALQILEASDAGKEERALITSTTPTIVSGARIVEGKFDGQKMMGDDGQPYSMAQNYASKSKLVVGDRLKLIISDSGNFVFKQIGPVERTRIVGTLAREKETGQFVVTHSDRRWHVLTASVTYFRGDPGDQVVVLVPAHGMASWAAVENIVKKSL